MLYFERSAKSAVKFRFGHGKYVDPWLLVHVISGILIGIVGLFFNLPLWQILTISLFLGFIYEVWESIIRIVEDVENSLIDIIGVGVGTLLSYWFFDFFTLTQLILILLGLAALNLLLFYIGWHSYLKRLTRNRLSAARYQQLGDKRDNVLFFGTVAAILPAPFLFQLDLKMALVWFLAIFLASAYARTA
ncbi:MAG: hypothetical protein CEO19_440 [Parcubacteria group bacterium Gr01-1014_73]|nr:MAG: hypothetical protein CEO19_440 [Parcubacteria group bacterium Gr01-1014_73]